MHDQSAAVSDGSDQGSLQPEGLPEGATLERVKTRGPVEVAMEILCIPGEGGELPPTVDAWVGAGVSGEAASASWMSLQGLRILWSPDRCAILAPSDRLPAVRNAVLDVSGHERALRAIERALDSAWPELDSDAPLAFEFEESAVGRRTELRERLGRVLLMRARLARIAPAVLAPPVYPPTLASQVADRLRERLRIASRYEAAAIQIDAFRDTYDMCGQRASDFMLARTGHRLEWVIIVLLAAQLLLWGFEYLTMASG